MIRSETIQPIPAVASLFEPFEIRGRTLRNRIVLPPMGIHWADDGVPTPAVAEYYARRAAGGASLLITEGTFIDHPVSAHHPGYLRMYSDESYEGWRQVVKRVHEEGGVLLPELWHCGLVWPAEDTRAGNFVYDKRRGMLSPSGLIMPGERVSDPMSRKEMDEVIESFARCAARSIEVGFDGVELHGAHGFLLDQFFWEALNDRTDAYGGSMRNRARYAAEVIEEVRRQIGPHPLISIRISQWKMQDFDAKVARTPAELADWLEPLVEAGVDVFDCSQRRYWVPEFDGEPLNFAGWVQKVSGKPAIAVGSVGLDIEMAESLMEGKTAVPTSIGQLIEMMDRKDFDLIAVGRSLIADPDWPKKVAGGRFDELRGFVPQVLKETSASYNHL